MAKIKVSTTKTSIVKKAIAKPKQMDKAAIKTSLKKTATASIKNNKINAEDFPIVGIGASAGGLETMELFFENTPINTGIAFVVIQHLDPTQVGMLPELLQRITPMSVYQASNNLKMEPNTIYVIPPNKSMTVLNGVLYLFNPVETRGHRLPIDIFLLSLAEDKLNKSIGIILSGMGTDGSLGLKAIKENNGLVLVQDPATAKFNGMPSSAVRMVNADIVATAEELPSKLIALLKKIPVENFEVSVDDKYAESLNKIIILLRQECGHDFTLYKKSTMMRRIERRMTVYQIIKIGSYLRYCQENLEELEILFKELLIGVTSFFRDADVWEKLKQQILPELIKQLPNGYTLRAWVAGCSTGEEAYSLAIAFQEVNGKAKNAKNIKLQIFATDLSVEAIEIARKGIYYESIASTVPPKLINRYFTKELGAYKIITTIREMVVFATQNVIKDPPFTKLDIITCRNMLIYMEPDLQKKVMALFNYSLKAGGVLLLGSAESLGAYNEGYDVLDNRLKFFKRTITPLHPITKDLIDFPSSFSSTMKIIPERKVGNRNIGNIHAIADSVLMKRFAPASVLVIHSGVIVYITGQTGKYLEPVAGKVNWNINAMAKDGIREQLPTAFRRVMNNYNALQLSKIKIGTNGKSSYVDIIIQQLDKPESLKGMIMIVFKDVLPTHVKVVKKTSTVNEQPSVELKEMELKLLQSFDDLKNSREEMQTSEEELKSINEEMQSTNEELQSTNEELTTSKEEMQSLNEELQTVNAELQTRVSDFVQANNDMKNLLNSTEIATLFLDKELNIRRFTETVTDIFKLRAIDIGRPFTDLVTDLIYPEMKSDALRVIKTLASIEIPIATSKGSWFKIRIMPYRTIDDRIDGIVITFFNITSFKKLEEELKDAIELLKEKENMLALTNLSYNRLFETANEGILIMDATTGKITDVNPYLITLLGFSKDQFVEKNIWEIGLFKDVVANKEKFAELKQKESVRYQNLPLETAEKKIINVEFVCNLYKVDNQSAVQCFIRESLPSGK